MLYVGGMIMKRWCFCLRMRFTVIILWNTDQPDQSLGFGVIAIVKSNNALDRLVVSALLFSMLDARQ